MSTPAELVALAALIALARTKGFNVDVSAVPGCWRLIGRDLRPAQGSNNSFAFTIAEAKAFLVALPDA